MLRSAFLLRPTVPARRFLNLSGTAPSRLLTTTSPSQQTDTAAPPAQTSTNSASTATIGTETEIPSSLPYLVSRTPSQNLPIYQDVKRGGNYKVTHLKKVAGDAQALKRNLAAALSLQPDQIRLNPVTGHIELRGHYKNEVAAYLTKQGF